MKHNTLITVMLLMSIHLNVYHPVYAQVILDGSMGTHTRLHGPDYEIKAGYGQQRGANLFHSFQAFSINTDESATFSGPATVRNIISRVTGGNRSWIDGELRSTIAGADLYLLNPAGMMFGANASLDISGSFHVSTADYLRMEGDERFYASARQGEVLSAESPTAFGFLDSDTALISFQGNKYEKAGDIPKGLAVPEGETISVIGGDIEITGSYYLKETPLPDGGSNTEDIPGGGLNAPEGQVNIAAIASEGEFVLNNEADANPDFSSFEKMGNITLDHSLINVSGKGSGNIFIRGGEFYADNARIKAETSGDSHGGITDIQVDIMSLTNDTRIFSNTWLKGSGGDISLRVSGTAAISGFSKVFADAGYETDNGDAGSVLIQAEHLAISGGGAVSSDTYGGGQGGKVELNVSESVDISGEGSILFANAMGEDPGAGNAGEILINTKSLSLSDRSAISSETYWGQGNGGNIRISGYGSEFAESVNVSDSGRIYGGAIRGKGEKPGHGGNIEINAENISFTDGGIIGSESDGAGNGGDVKITGTESVIFSGSGDYGPSKVYTSALSTEDNAGSAGNIFVQADSILFEKSGGVTASTKGPGNAGFIEIKTRALNMDEGSVSSASKSPDKGGSAGRINIISGMSVVLDNHSEITTATAGEKSIGPLGEEKGNAGDIDIETCRLELDRDSSVSSESTSKSDNAGDAGTITTDICESLSLKNNSSVTTQAHGGGGGRIFVKAENKLYLLDSQITSSVRQGYGNGGDVTVGSLSPEGKKTGAEFVILNNSDITANADFGDGGAIFIITENYIKSEDSDVTAKSKRGNDGTVRIEAPDLDISSGLVVLPGNYMDVTRWVKKSCAARSGEKSSRFVIKGRDAMSASFTDLQPGKRIWTTEAK